ncbi:heavy metal resistance protein [Sphingomonas sp. Leaf22]|uniref:periplasmic heavy metal sensor n=1 Tax=Sphingomonas sp. Leaf22 TaxID=1735687 RepID=UPI0007006D76|nr:periplasmic heavy metal sensor [Sphingomonas sp. Leaf22]KQM93498.1 heavy metal resistance protein [Sphingomonas sp. Leaf22]
MSRTRWTVLVAIVAFLAALGGVLAGRLIGDRPATAHGGELHALLHDDMQLTPGQMRRLDALEAEYATRRAALQAQMRADNARLAQAIAAEQDDGPRVAAAVDASHRTMGTLQKATLAHVFAMRRLLRPDQTPAFDRAVARALTHPAQ